MGEAKFSFFVADIILLIVFLGLILVIFRFSGLGFLLQLLFAVVLFLIAFTALIPAYSGSKTAWSFLGTIFFLVLLDLLFIYMKVGRTSKAFYGSLLFAALGFVVSVVNIKDEEDFEESSEEEEKEEAYTNFEPGKYVASKTGSTYHVAKCDWAKKIKEKNRIWFDDEKEAKKQFKAHSCLK